MGVDAVTKINDDTYVLGVIKIYSHFLFVVSVVLKKVELLKILKVIESNAVALKILTIMQLSETNSLVSPYYTLFFSRKWILRFSEVALISVHCNFVIGCIAIPREYWPWKTANTAENICLLVKSDSKNTKAERKVRSGRFYQPFGFPKANLGLLARKQAHSPDVNRKTTSSTTQKL